MSYILQTSLFPNSSTVAAMSAWASAVGNALISCGWKMTTDTGQVQWTGLSITGWSQSGTTITATYSSLTGNQLVVGRQIAFTATTYGGTYIITGVTVGSSTTGTFTFTSANIPTGTGTATLLAAVPSSAFTAYEIWQPNDVLQTGSTAFYLKIGFGYSTTIWGFQTTLGTGTNGSGTLNGYVTSSNIYVNATNDSYPRECSFSGDTNRFSMCFDRNGYLGGYSYYSGICIERTHNSDGSDSSDGVTLFLCSSTSYSGMQTIEFGVGAAAAAPGGASRYFYNPDYNTGYNSNILGTSCALSPFLPFYGKFGNPMIGIVGIRYPDVGNGSLFTATVYGVVHTYIAAQLGVAAATGTPGYSYIGVRFD